MRLVLLSLTLLFTATPAAAAQDEVDPTVEGLRGDSVHVAPGASGDAGALREAVEDSGIDLNVAVLPAGADPARVAPLVYERLGEEGTLVVVSGDEDSGYRIVAGPSQDARKAAAEAAAANPDGSVEAVVADFVDRVDGGGSGDEGGIGAGSLIVLGLAGAGGAAMMISRGRRRREQAAELAEVKENVRDDLVALGDEIRSLDLDIQMPATSPEARADYETAVNAYDRANRTYELARRPEDLEPVGEALEEGRWAMLSARARLEGSEPPERRPPCFFDPRHGPSTRDVEWAPYGGTPRMVPACEADAQQVERGEGDGGPAFREVVVGGERMPYWAAGPAYAPFMGGFFGAGLLPGLMMGTMLGSAWDAPAADAGGDFGGGDFGGGFGGGDFGGGDFGG